MMADQGFKKGPSSNIQWGSFTNSTLFGGLGSALKSSEQSGVVPKIELKRMRSMGSSDEDENHYAKRTKRESPPKALTKLSSAANSFRRGGSVKSLIYSDVHPQEPPRNSQITSLQSEASFANGRSSLSRAPSLGLSAYLENVKLQTPMSETPSGSGGIAPRTAGVSQKAYDVHRSLGSLDNSHLRSSVESIGTSGSSGRASTVSRTTPMGASFGPARRAFDRAMSIVDSVRSASKSPPILSKPTLDRHVSSAPYAGVSGSISSRKQTTRLGDNSLARARTVSLHSSVSAVSPSSNASANDRTTPTPRDGSVSSPPGVSSPPSVTSGLSSPPAQTSPLPQHAQRALISLGEDTPLKHSRSFSQPYQTKLKVPMPSKKSSVVSWGHSSDASSKRGGSSAIGRQTKKTEKLHAPYSIRGELTGTRKIMEKRRAEEKEPELLDSNRREEDMEDLHIEPIRKGKENADPTLNGSHDNESIASLNTISTKSYKSRVPTSSESGTSSRTIGQSSLRQGREKQNVHSISPEKRPRLGVSEIPSKLNPAINERIQSKTSTGRFSVPPDEDDDNDMTFTEEKKTPPARRTPLVVFTDATDGTTRNDTGDSKTVPMNITPVKEKADVPDSGSDVMSTTPTESSIKAAFTITPIIPPSAPAPSLPLPSPINTTPARSSAITAEDREDSSMSTSPVVVEASGVANNVNSSSAKPSTLGSAFSLVLPPAIPAAPASEAPKLFSLGSLPKPNEGSESKPTAPPQQANLFSFPTAKPAASTEAPKPFSFAAPPATTGDAPKGFSFTTNQPVNSTSNAASKAPKVAPLLFSFGKPTEAAPSTEPAKPVALFSFQPSKPSTSEAPKLAATSALTTPSSTNPPFSFSTTPATAPPLNLSTTPQITPLSHVSESPSPVKPPGVFQGLFELTTPSKPPMFGAGETTPSTTPKPFNFGSTAVSTTPAATPASFVFGTSNTSVTPLSTSFQFGGPSTTPAVTPAAVPSTTPAPTPTALAPPPAFSFAFTGLNNPFQKPAATAPPADKGFAFGATPAASTTSAPFNFGTPSEEPSKHQPPATNTFSFGQPPATNGPSAGGFGFGVSTTPAAPPPNNSGLLFPTGPTTPLMKSFELDSMDSSPIRVGGVTSTGVGPSFREASNGPGFSFTQANTASGGFGAPPPAAPFGGPSGFGGQNNALGFGKEPSPAPFSFGSGPSSTPFGQTPTPTPTTPFGPGFGQPGGFPFSQPAASPFTQTQSLGSPAPSGFTQLASPAASPFAQNISLAPSQGQKRQLSPGEDFAGGAPDAGADGRKLMPMPKPRRNRTQAETRSALAKFHRG